MSGKGVNAERDENVDPSRTSVATGEAHSLMLRVFVPTVAVAGNLPCRWCHCAPSTCNSTLMSGALNMNRRASCRLGSADGADRGV